MSIEYIRETYKVPAKIGGRVRYTGSACAMLGTITGTRSAHIIVKLDEKEDARPFHPTWEMEYLPNE